MSHTTEFIDLCISNGMASHSCFAPDRVPLAMQSSISPPMSANAGIRSCRRLSNPPKVRA